MNIKTLFFTFIILITTLFFTNKTVLAESGAETLEATVTKILEEKEVELGFSDEKQFYQELELYITKGSLKHNKIVVKSGDIPVSNLPRYKVNDRLLVNYEHDLDGNDFFLITDYVRRRPLFILFILFIVSVSIIAKWRGISSVLGMIVSFLIIFSFILPRIDAGANPVQTAILGSLLIIPATFYLSHGLNKKTTSAVLGTVIALVITGTLALIFVNMAQLSGFASEEAGFLQVAKQGSINIKGLLLAGIIIGILGVLDDVTISQSAIVFQLKNIDSKLNISQLYKRAMDVGQDHISSMVNTLILVYTGASLPLLLLFINNPHPFTEIINYEIIADEIIRTLIGSIGLILAVPITTIIASILVSQKKS